MESPSEDQLRDHLQTLEQSQFSFFVRDHLFPPIRVPDLSVKHDLIPKPPSCIPCVRSRDITYRCALHFRLCNCGFQTNSKTSWKDHLRIHNTGTVDKKAISRLRYSQIANQATKSYEHYLYLQPNGSFWKERLLEWICQFTKDIAIEIGVFIWFNPCRPAS